MNQAKEVLKNLIDFKSEKLIIFYNSKQTVSNKFTLINY